MIVSIVKRTDVDYPDSSESFSPSERYPEYPFEHIAARPNPVYAMVRDVLAQTGLDAKRFGTADWNPLGEYIRPGASVFALCNFVYHSRGVESVEEFRSKCTHGSVLRALLDYVVLAAGRQATIRFGNAPLQSCDWNRVLADTGADRVARFYEQEGIGVRPTDLRLYVAERSSLGRVISVDRRDTSDAAAEIDLREKSLLDELTQSGAKAPRFGISDYNPERIAAFHARGAHRYVINRAILDSDVVLSVPKLKTHEKVGVTCALKGFVGTVGHKDCLAHHRSGGPEIGGDEFPAGSHLMSVLSKYHDWLNRRKPDASLQGWFQILERVARKIARTSGATLHGAWYGNDTAWRMAVDLARIVHHARTDGTMDEDFCRRHLVLLDGIVAGEGDGPLRPAPARAGALLFADDVVAADRFACRLMGFDPDTVPLVREASRVMEFPLVAENTEAERIVVNGESVSEDAVEPGLGRPFVPPRGWRGHLGQGT
jgi:uncharacterized protein (DUF362 family)